MDGMTPEELQSLATAAYGPHGWQSRLAREMPINLRTVQRWAADGIAKTLTARSVRTFLSERGRMTIPEAPDDDEMRGEAIVEAVAPHLSALVGAALQAGYSPIEVLSAILAVANERYAGIDRLRLDGDG